MFRSFARVLGRCALFSCAAALIVAASFFLIGSYFLTWPVLRVSPRQRHLTAAMNLAASVMTMFAVLQANDADNASTVGTDSDAPGPVDFPQEPPAQSI